jgi:hypothetical protein
MVRKPKKEVFLWMVHYYAKGSMKPWSLYGR